MSHVNYMAHKTYNLISLQICSILMSLSALSCCETGSGGMSKRPALFYTSLLFSAAGHCPQGSSDKGGGSWGPAGSQCRGAPGQALCTCWRPAWFPSSPSDSWGHVPFTGTFASHLDMRYFPLGLKCLRLWISEARVRSPTRKGKHSVHIRLV